jgi:hypothetical protein
VAIYFPIIQSESVVEAFSNEPKLQEFLASGVLDLGTLEAIWAAQNNRGGEYITIPTASEWPAMERTDLTVTTGANFTAHSTVEQKIPIIHSYTGKTFLKADVIRSGEDLAAKLGATAGKAIATRALELITYMLKGSIDAVDTPSTDCHVADFTSNPLTLARLRAAKQKLGDHGLMLNTLFCHSKVWNDIVTDILATFDANVFTSGLLNNGTMQMLFGISNIIIYDGSANFPTDNAGTSSDIYHSYLLGPGSIYMAYQAAPDQDSFLDIDSPSSQFKVKLSNALALGLRGMKYTGSANPADSTLGNGSNWDEAYNDHRAVMAVKIKSN